jgi:hypothetical protein
LYTPQRGTDFLAYRDARGLVVHFHVLRHTYISRLVRSGTSRKVALELARHCDVRLTLGRYTHAEEQERVAAVQGLPALLPSSPDAHAATGTEGEFSAAIGKRPDHSGAPSW